MKEIIMNLSKLVKILVYLLCFTMFFASLWTLFKKHVEELTGISVEMIPEDRLTPPSLTVCSEEPFKSNGDFYLEEDFVQNTFTTSEIFGPDFKIDNVSNILTETRSESYGLCYTLTRLYPVGVRNLTAIPLTTFRTLSEAL